MPTQAYHDAVAEGARHQQDSKTYSGKMLRPHKPYLVELAREHGCHSGLDVGSGKGAQFSWVDPSDGLTIEQALGFEMVKHDPCWPPYAAEPDGTFDLVTCTHTISLIPLSDLEWFTQRLCDFANKVVFVAEKIGPRKKGEIADPENRAIGWDRGQWQEWFDGFARSYPDLTIILSTLERLDRGKVTTRHIWSGGNYEEYEVWAA